MVYSHVKVLIPPRSERFDCCAVTCCAWLYYFLLRHVVDCTTVVKSFDPMIDIDRAVASNTGPNEKNTVGFCPLTFHGHFIDYILSFFIYFSHDNDSD